jgi:hypothetical protein
MFSKRATVAFLAVAIGLAAAGRALAADVLDAIPNTALAVILVNRLEATSDKIEKLAVKVQAPSVSLLSLARVQTGIHDGLDDKGTAALAWLPSEGQPLESPVSIVVLPVTDYAKFIAQLQPENPKDKITQVYVAGKAVLACQRGDFAVLAGVEDEAALKDVLASVKSVGEDLSPLRTWLAEVDAAVVATPAAIRIASSQANEKLSATIELLEQQGGVPAAANGLPALKIIQKVLAAGGDELQLAAIGIRADEAGTVRLTSRLRLTSGGRWAAIAERIEGPSKSLLTGLPEGPFVLTAAIQYSDPLRGLTNWFFSEDGRKLNPALDKLPAEQQTKLADLFGRITQQQESAKFWIGAPKADEPLFASAILIAKVEDTKKYFAQIDELGKLQVGAGENAPSILSLGEVQHIQVDGQDAIDYVASMKQIEAGQPAPLAEPVREVLKKMLGSDEKIHTYMAAIDDHTVVSAYVSVDNLRRAIAAARQGGASSGLAPQAAEIAALLPTGAQTAVLVQPAGITQWVQALTAVATDQKGPALEFPASPPIGLALKFSSAGVLGDAVIPGATLEAIGEFVAKERNKR